MSGLSGAVTEDDAADAVAIGPRTDVALRIRALELLLLDLFRDGGVAGTVHAAVGQEFCAAALHPHLDPAQDSFVGSHRAHGHYLASGAPVDALLAELMGRDGALCGGRGGSQHLHHERFFSSGIQGGGSLWGAGLAWAHRLECRDGLVVVQLGDGTLGEGAVYEAFTFAAIGRAPVLFYLEWNGYAQSTDTAATTPGDVLTRARGFGLEVHRHADRDPDALHAHLGDVVARVREGIPTLQVVDTRRLLAHSKGDDHRPPAVLTALRREDPLSRLLASHSAVRERFEAIRQELRVLADEVASRPLVGAMSPWAGQGVRTPVVGTRTVITRTEPAPTGAGSPHAPATVRDQLNGALARCLAEDDRVLLVGQDLADPYGGAFAVTRSLSTRFPGRVISTPVAEAGLVGLGCGLALAGWRPVAEIMFADFAALACDQIVNHAAKFRGMYGDHVRCPLVVRVASGGGRGYGPTHSQSLEHLFFGVPGLRVVSLSARHDAGHLLHHVVCHADGPVIFVEHKRTYGEASRLDPPLDLERVPSVRGGDPLAPLCFGSSRASMTVVTCGGCTDLAEDGMVRLFEDHEITCNLIVLTELWPLDAADVVRSVARTGRLLVVEEGGADYGVGAAVLSAVAQAVPVRGRTVGAQSVPIPAARHLEAGVLPSVERMVAAALELA